ncbi:MAG: peptidylprolyl isomerase [Candidatus Rokubacteria bacterium]|nr:peptidylprolyl isomerase [Candidatus Rokubacteria bacterium]
MKTAAVIVLTLGLGLGVGWAQPQEKAVSPVIETGSTVQLEYTLKDDGGKVLESNRGRGPLTFTQGEQQIIPGLEKALNGLRAGDEKHVTVKPEEGYGPLDPAAQTEVPKGMLPPGALVVGTELIAQSPQGGARLVRVKEVKESTVIIDLNHPLAGKTLYFDLKVLGVDPPKK